MTPRRAVAAAALVVVLAAFLGSAAGQARLPTTALVYGPPVAAAPADRWATDPGDGVY